MKRYAAFLYGVVCYGFGFGSLVYAIGFLGNFIVPKSIDSAPELPLHWALLVDAGLLAVFAVQHSVMARQGFKKWWTRFVPAAVERSTYVFASSLAMFLLFWQWQPLGGTIWNVTDPTGRIVLWSVFALGWVTVLGSTFLINHFDLFGLRQVWLYLRGREYTALPFRTPGLYRFVRHPLYVGWLMAIWATPKMGAAHLVFAVGTAVYILVAIQFEERDLVDHFGEQYVDYKKQTPMLVPIPMGSKNVPAPTH